MHLLWTSSYFDSHEPTMVPSTLLSQITISIVLKKIFNSMLDFILPEPDLLCVTPPELATKEVGRRSWSARAWAIPACRRRDLLLRATTG